MLDEVAHLPVLQKPELINGLIWFNQGGGVKDVFLAFRMQGQAGVRQGKTRVGLMQS